MPSPCRRQARGRYRHPTHGLHSVAKAAGSHHAPSFVWGGGLWGGMVSGHAAHKSTVLVLSLNSRLERNKEEGSTVNFSAGSASWRKCCNGPSRSARACNHHTLLVSEFEFDGLRSSKSCFEDRTGQPAIQKRHSRVTHHPVGYGGLFGPFGAGSP